MSPSSSSASIWSGMGRSRPSNAAVAGRHCHLRARRFVLRFDPQSPRAFRALPPFGDRRFHAPRLDAVARSRGEFSGNHQPRDRRTGSRPRTRKSARDQRRRTGDAARDGRRRRHASRSRGRDDPGDHQAGRQDGEGLHDAARGYFRAAGRSRRTKKPSRSCARSGIAASPFMRKRRITSSAFST